MTVNLFMILNTLLGPKYVFSKQKPSDLKACDGKPDATCRYNDEITIAIEFKRQLVLKLNEGQLDYDDKKTKDVVGQIYSYMAELELQYGVLSTYENNWFLFRPKNNPTVLKISRAIRLDSTSPTVLESYAFLAILAKDDPKSPHPNIIANRTRGS